MGTVSPSRSQGGVLERLVIAPGSGLLVRGQGLLQVPEGPHPHVAGVDDFCDAGATAWRDPVRGRGDTQSHLTLLWGSTGLRTVSFGVRQGSSGSP